MVELPRLVIHIIDESGSAEVKAVGDEKYQFRDSTGTITVEIDDELWQGKPISAKTPVIITGEIDIDYKPAKRVEIEVDQVRF